MSSIEEKLSAVVAAVSAHLALLEEDGVSVLDLPVVSREEIPVVENVPPVEHDKGSTCPVVADEVTRALGAASKRERMQALHARVMNCAQCADLVASRTHVVFGSGTIKARLCFVGEAPGHDEDIQGAPFVGKAGQLLTKMIESIGLKREHVFIANVLKCRPPQNRNPRPEEIVQCQKFLKEQLAIIQPKVICALGTFAAQTLLNSKEPISRMRGTFYDYQGMKLLPTFHPAFLLRSEQNKKHAWEDMKMIREELLKG